MSSKNRILKSAVRIFARKGYASTGVRELAEDAGVNLAMINYCFGSKKELLKVILDTFFEGYLQIVEEELSTPQPLDDKIKSFIHRAVKYISENQDYMIVTLAELPHDDPEITEHKARWASRAMITIQQEICLPIKDNRNVDLSPAAIGPLIIGMMSSRFLFSSIMEQISPPGYGEDFFKEYPNIISNIFLNGINGLTNVDEASNE